GINEEDAIFVIDSAKDLRNDNGDIAFFQNPFGLSMHKSEALITYELSDCLWHSLHNGETCSYKKCLKVAFGCGSGLYILNQMYRSDVRDTMRTCSRGCVMKTGHMMYKSCDTKNPHLAFEASLTIDIGGYPKARLFFDNSKKVGVSRDFSIVANAESDLYTYKLIPNLQSGLLTMPCTSYLDENKIPCQKYLLDRKNSLMIPKGEFTRMGECNKIGVTLRGWVASFLKNPQKNCFEPMRTCLTNDMASKLKAWECACATIPAQTKEPLKINLEINLDNVLFLQKRSLGIITSIKVIPPGKTHYDTSISATILNIGSSISAFKVLMECDVGVEISKADKIEIAPQELGSIELIIILPDDLKFEFSCYVTLQDVQGSQLDQRLIWVSTFASAYASKFKVSMTRLHKHHIASKGPYTISS
ncbi:hypothetical protein GOP47_0013786, partial [Adiantum capillus-veneris]